MTTNENGTQTVSHEGVVDGILNDEKSCVIDDNDEVGGEILTEKIANGKSGAEDTPSPSAISKLELADDEVNRKEMSRKFGL